MKTVRVICNLITVVFHSSRRTETHIFTHNDEVNLSRDLSLGLGREVNATPYVFFLKCPPNHRASCAEILLSYGELNAQLLAINF